MYEKNHRAKNITKSFDGVPVLQNVNLDIYDNEFITLLGPSGCGKTNHAPPYRRLQTPDEGTLSSWATKSTTSPHKRNVNTVFQKVRPLPPPERL